MGNKPKQRFIELEVGEVSIVDRPANECEFVVIKNLDKEVGTMINEDVKKDANENDGVQTSPEMVAVEIAKSTDEAVAKAMEQVTTLISDISKAVGAKSAVTDTPPEKRNDAVAAPTEVPAQKETVNEEPNDAETEKSFETALGALSMIIEKAKRFTPKREATLKEALEKLASLAKELGMEDVPVGESPNVTPPAGATYGASSIAKAIEGIKAQFETMVTEVQQTTKSLGDRLEKIEKVRMPSNSVENAGGTDTQETKKSFWSGIL
jgi:hypothetical protein